MTVEAADGGGCWSFLTNHGHVLLALYRDPELRQREIAAQVGITEGRVHGILHDLERCGYVRIERVGRRNRYVIDGSLGFRHPLEDGHSVGELLERLAPVGPAGQARPVRPARQVETAGAGATG